MPSPVEEKHLRKQSGELQERYDTLTKRIAALDIDIGRALDSRTKQVLEEERAEKDAERNQVATKMANIERQRNEPTSAPPIGSPPPTKPRPRRWFGQLSNTGTVAVIVGIGLVLAALICMVARITPSPTLTFVALRTDHGRYVTALKDNDAGGRDWMLWAETKKISYWEKFALKCVEDGKAAIRTHHGRYATTTSEDKDWVLIATTEEVGDSERFTLFDASTQEKLLCSDVLQEVEQNPVSLVFQTADGWYVTAMNGEQDGNWTLQGHAPTINKWEKFTMIER